LGNLKVKGPLGDLGIDRIQKWIFEEWETLMLRNLLGDIRTRDLPGIYQKF
jgi:hypothetical protein